jgi:CheY-like chemotaxis protein/Tfp pilus assembly protein PilZ
MKFPEGKKGSEIMNTADPNPPVMNRRKQSILVVGNKAQELITVSLLLQRFDYVVVTANTAAQALERVSIAVPALIITDLTLPGMSGMDLLHLLKQERRTASIPVVYLVPMTDASSERRCLDLGAAGCISKPVRAEELYRTVQAAIEPWPRESIRIDTRLPVTVNNVPLDCSGDTCEIDLSEQGMFVPMQKPYPRNRRVTVKISINDRTISAEGAVIYCHTAGEGRTSEPGIGLKFVNIAPQDQEFIRKFIRDEVNSDIKAALSREASETL